MSYQYILDKVIVGKYNEVRIHPLTKVEYLHSGIDYALNKNTPILASGGGIITYAEWCSGYGNLIMIDHGDGIVSMYAHLQRFKRLNGDKVKRGDVIGYVGSTGMAYGNHIHFEIRKNGKPIFPGRYINLRKK
jgi:murein DD-endopeptidase MepM/ murein hydrolase activator NlpD